METPHNPRGPDCCGSIGIDFANMATLYCHFPQAIYFELKAQPLFSDVMMTHWLLSTNILLALGGGHNTWPPENNTLLENILLALKGGQCQMSVSYRSIGVLEI